MQITIEHLCLCTLVDQVGKDAKIAYYAEYTDLFTNTNSENSKRYFSMLSAMRTLKGFSCLIIFGKVRI